VCGDPSRTRTCDLRFRKPSLYPPELWDRRNGRRIGADGVARKEAVGVADCVIQAGGCGCTPEGVALITELNRQDQTWVMTCNHAVGDG
jgi:hypothetical protein